MQVQSIKTPSDYRSERENLFPSPAALGWFMRRWRPELNAAGALVVVNRRLLIVPEAFDGVVLRVGAAAAAGHETVE